VAAVSCHGRIVELEKILTRLAEAFPDTPPPLVAVGDPDAREKLAGRRQLGDRLLAAGPEGLVEAVTQPATAHCLVNGLVGAVGLEPTLAAAGGAEVLPVDSEHSAIAQCLSGRLEGEIDRLILTASGGPFRQTPAADLARVTLEQVLDHPTLNMGPKITVDSATLMNKGLEIIEAHHLFGLPYERIDVLVHPGSYVHSLVEFTDGAILAQLGTPDMRLPLQYAISGERHRPLPGERLDLLKVGSLHFEAPDLDRFPCLRLARQAGQAGQAATIVLNAANEVAVAALLQGRITYADIPRVVESTLAAEPVVNIDCFTTALAVDEKARATADGLVAALPEPGS
jgi:1-deoxy-D-xylulose-5-phosphate reductoisomerase